MKMNESLKLPSLNAKNPPPNAFPERALPGADNSWLATEFVALTFLCLRSIFCGRRLLVRDRRGRCCGSNQPVSQPPIYLNAIGKQLPRGRGLPKRLLVVFFLEKGGSVQINRSRISIRIWRILSGTLNYHNMTNFVWQAHTLLVNRVPQLP